MLISKRLFNRRKRRNRYNLRRSAKGKLRLSIFRSNLNIYAQVIDDENGVTVAAASSTDKVLREKLKAGGNKDAAGAVGKLIAERATKVGVSVVVFDRGGYAYHGRVKALAEAAREGGLAF